jgi:hypothetical protein
MRSQPENGCVCWEREPGSDDETLRIGQNGQLEVTEAYR